MVIKVVLVVATVLMVVNIFKKILNWYSYRYAKVVAIYWNKGWEGRILKCSWPFKKYIVTRYGREEVVDYTFKTSDLKHYLETFFAACGGYKLI
jgi:hypothetical protein